MIGSTGLLSVAVALGCALGLMHLRGARKPWLTAVHAVIGLVGLALLIPVLQGPPRGAAQGMGAFGAAAGWLFGLAVPLALGAHAVRRRWPVVGGIALASHATLAITGFALLLAWVSAP